MHGTARALVAREPEDDDLLVFNRGSIRMTERAFWETQRDVSHDEAREACQRFINSHFRNPDGARVSIPANPDRDDDLLLSSYIEQQARAAAAAALAPKEDVDDVIRSVLEHAVDGMGWPEIDAFHAELARGQDITEDGAGFFLRAIRRLFGLPTNVRTVETYQAAARAMIRGVA